MSELMISLENGEYEMKTYENLKYGFSISYPGNLGFYENFNGTLVTFVFPGQAADDGFLDNFNVTASDFKGNMTLDYFLKMSLNDLRKIVQNFCLEETTDILINESETHKIVYSGEVQGKSLKWLQVMTIKENIIYVLTYTARQERFELNRGILESIIGTFQHVNL